MDLRNRILTGLIASFALTACGDLAASDTSSASTATSGAGAGGGAGSASSSSTAASPSAATSSSASSSTSSGGSGSGAGGPGSEVPPDFFGVSAGPPSDPGAYPTVSVGAIGHPGNLAWSTVEPSRGLYDFSYYDAQVDKAVAHGVPMSISFGWTPAWAAVDTSTCVGAPNAHCTAPPADVQDWKDFVTTIVTRYKGKVRYWEIWNEANGMGFWTGTVDELVALAAAAYPIIKGIDPLAVVVAPTTSGHMNSATAWLASYFAAGGGAYADACGAHGYPEQVTPLPFPETSTPNGAIVERLAAFRKTCDAGGLAGKPLVMSEGSWGQNQNITDPQHQAAWLARYQLLQAGARTELNLAATVWYAWGAGGPSQYGSIANADNTPTPAGTAFGEVYDWLAHASISPCAAEADGQTYTCTLTRGSDPSYSGLVVWNTAGAASYPVAQSYVHVRDLAGGMTPISGNTVMIGPAPILLESK